MRQIALISFVTAVCLLSACSKKQQIPDAFIGTWQSDEALTLASLDNSNSVTSADIEIFSDKFFGNRVIVYRGSELRSYWVGEEWAGVKQDDKWYPYDIIASGPDFMTLRYPATEYSEVEEKTWRLDGELIFVEEPRWDFREYYRRIGD